MPDDAFTLLAAQSPSPASNGGLVGFAILVFRLVR